MLEKDTSFMTWTRELLSPLNLLLEITAIILAVCRYGGTLIFPLHILLHMTDELFSLSHKDYNLPICIIIPF